MGAPGSLTLRGNTLNISDFFNNAKQSFTPIARGNSEWAVRLSKTHLMLYLEKLTQTPFTLELLPLTPMILELLAQTPYLKSLRCIHGKSMNMIRHVFGLITVSLSEAVLIIT